MIDDALRALQLAAHVIQVIFDKFFTHIDEIIPKKLA